MPLSARAPPGANRPGKKPPRASTHSKSPTPSATPSHRLIVRLRACHARTGCSHSAIHRDCSGSSYSSGTSFCMPSVTSVRDRATTSAGSFSKMVSVIFSRAAVSGMATRTGPPGSAKCCGICAKALARVSRMACRNRSSINWLSASEKKRMGSPISCSRGSGNCCNSARGFSSAKSSASERPAASATWSQVSVRDSALSKAKRVGNRHSDTTSSGRASNSSSNRKGERTMVFRSEVIDLSWYSNNNALQ